MTNDHVVLFFHNSICDTFHRCERPTKVHSVKDVLLRFTELRTVQCVVTIHRRRLFPAKVINIKLLIVDTCVFYFHDLMHEKFHRSSDPPRFTEFRTLECVVTIHLKRRLFPRKLVNVELLIARRACEFNR